jgi:hypothetical protein
MSTFHVDPKFQPLMREIGLDADAIFTHPLIKPWRTLDDRENCTLDFTSMSGDSIRWHVKRYPQGNARTAHAEVEGAKLLCDAGIPTLNLIAWGEDATGRSFTISEDLAGFEDSEKLVRNGLWFAPELDEACAKMTGDLHDAGLHHRDLYLCHFFCRIKASKTELRLIDVARVKKLPKLFRSRWIVKDLAQFWYSLTQAGVTDEDRRSWLWKYARYRGISAVQWLAWRVKRKATWIARHDAKLREKQPGRNISLQKGSSTKHDG